MCLHPNLFPIFISNFHRISPSFYEILVLFAINPIFLDAALQLWNFPAWPNVSLSCGKSQCPKKTLKDLYKSWKAIAQDHFKNLKKVCYLESKRKINQGLLKTFALCCILSCYCVLCLSVRAVMSASTAPTRQETSSWNCTTGVSTSPAGAPTRSADRRLLKSCSLFHPDTVQSEWDSVEL